MDILRSIFDMIADLGQGAEDKEFATGCGCGCLATIVVLGLVAAGGFWIGKSW